MSWSEAPLSSVTPFCCGSFSRQEKWPKLHVCLQQFVVDVLLICFRNVFRNGSSICLWLCLAGLELRLSKWWHLLFMPSSVTNCCLKKCCCIGKLGTWGSSQSSPTVSLVVVMRSENVSSVLLLSRKCRQMSADLCASSHVVELLWRLVDSSLATPHTRLSRLRPKEAVNFCMRANIPEAFREYCSDPLAISSSLPQGCVVG